MSKKGHRYFPDSKKSILTHLKQVNCVICNQIFYVKYRVFYYHERNNLTFLCGSEKCLKERKKSYTACKKNKILSSSLIAIRKEEMERSIRFHEQNKREHEKLLTDSKLWYFGTGDFFYDIIVVQILQERREI